MAWHGHLRLRYRRDAQRTVAYDRHSGPLRVLAGHYPEGPGICHHVLVHPPGGLAGGDELAVEVDVGPAAHALITTPGANRFYRSDGPQAKQQVSLRLDAGARLEWLPLEAIVFSGACVDNRIHLELGPGAETIGWDLLALGLPAADKPFAEGSIGQCIDWPGRWLERGCIEASDHALLDTPLGFGGQRVLGLAWFAAADGLTVDRAAHLLNAARASVSSHALAATAGVTAPCDGLVLLRVLAPRVEPAMNLLTAVWAAWRQTAWECAAPLPRIWRT